MRPRSNTRSVWLVIFLLTFHYKDQRADVAFFDDAGIIPIIYGVHAVHDLLDLRQLQVLHEVIVQDGLFYELLRPERQGERRGVGGWLY